jgi:hypothetical protein
MLKTLAAARAREVYWSGRTAQIKAAVMAMIFFIIPLAALAAFGVHSAMGGTLTIAQVFYVVALLALPRLTMVEYFAQGERLPWSAIHEQIETCARPNLRLQSDMLTAMLSDRVLSILGTCRDALQHHSILVLKQC